MVRLTVGARVAGLHFTRDENLLLSPRLLCVWTCDCNRRTCTKSLDNLSSSSSERDFGTQSCIWRGGGETTNLSLSPFASEYIYRNLLGRKQGRKEGPETPASFLPPFFACLHVSEGEKGEEGREERWR